MRLTVWRQSEKDWVFPRSFFAQTPKGFEDITERWNDPCMERESESTDGDPAGESHARPGWRSEGAPNGCRRLPYGRNRPSILGRDDECPP